MSKIIRLLDPSTGRPIELDFPHFTGSMIITEDDYKCIKYVDHAYGALFDFEQLKEISAFESITRLGDAVDMLGIEISDRHQEATPGNVGFICNVLLEWANLYPHGVWSVT